MKGIGLVVVLLAISFTGHSQSTPGQMSEDFKKLNWLIGTWNRTNSKPGRSGVEQWRKTGAHELRGMGATLHETDTLFVEKLRLTIKDNYIAYVAEVSENKKPVYFKLTEITNSGFVCENPEHDFPKKISYQLTGNQLKAQISGDGKIIDYTFERK